jgi:hypothetical protein
MRARFDMNQTIRFAFGALLATASLMGCASLKPEPKDHSQTFSDAVRECRPKRSGRPTQNVHPIPTQGPMAECLKRHGWNPDGTRR